MNEKVEKPGSIIAMIVLQIIPLALMGIAVAYFAMAMALADSSEFMQGVVSVVDLSDISPEKLGEIAGRIMIPVSCSILVLCSIFIKNKVMFLISTIILILEFNIFSIAIMIIFWASKTARAYFKKLFKNIESHGE